MALELEHERGKLTGLGQSNAALREHNSILETALAKREADLVQLNLQVLRLLCRRQGLDAGQRALCPAWPHACVPAPEAERCPTAEMRKRGRGSGGVRNPPRGSGVWGRAGGS